MIYIWLVGLFLTAITITDQAILNPKQSGTVERSNIKVSAQTRKNNSYDEYTGGGALWGAQFPPTLNQLNLWFPEDFYVPMGA